MGYSSNPETYSEEEHAILLNALGADITLNFPDSKSAFNQRGRFYGLRKAALKALEKNLRMKKQGLSELCSKTEIITRALEVQKVGIGWANEAKTSIKLGRNVGNATNQAIMRQALGDNYRTPTDILNEEAEASAAAALRRHQGIEEAEVDNTHDAITDYLNQSKENDDE